MAHPKAALYRLSNKLLLTGDNSSGYMLGMKDIEVIEALGGAKVVGPALSLEPENAAHLEKRPTPWKHRPAIKALARRKRVSLPSDYLEVRR